MHPSPLKCIPEDQDTDDIGGEDCNSIGPVAWVAILREGCLLVDIGEQHVPDSVVATAQGLLWSSTADVGWEEYMAKEFVLTEWKGLRYDINEAERSWTFACVYNGEQYSLRHAQSFVQGIVEWTSTVRLGDATWRDGEHHACQALFAPLLQDRLQSLTNAKRCEPHTILEEGEEDESDNDENPNEALVGGEELRPSSPVGPPKLRNVARGEPIPGAPRDWNIDEQTASDLIDGSGPKVQPTMPEKEKFESDVAIEPKRLDNIWDTTLATVTSPTIGHGGSLVEDEPNNGVDETPFVMVATPTKASPVRSRGRKLRNSPGQKESVEELVERLAKKQAEKEHTPSKQPARGRSISETCKNSDSGSSTSATVEEEEDFEGYVFQKSGDDKNCLCWIPSPLPPSKKALLQ